MRVSVRVYRLVHRPQHVGVTVTETRHRRSAGRIEVFLALVVDDADAAPRDGERERVTRVAMEDAAHWVKYAGLVVSQFGAHLATEHVVRPAGVHEHDR